VTKIYYLEFLRASEGTLSRWSRLHLQVLTSGRRPVVKIIAESLSQHDEKHVVPTPLSGIRVGGRRPRPNTNRNVHVHKCLHGAGIEPATSCVVGEYSHHYATSSFKLFNVWSLFILQNKISFKVVFSLARYCL
jgi:hypothetical protein